MKISQKGLYALEALIFLARRQYEGPMKIHEIAASEALPKKFLELILLELKHARIVESVRGANGGYRLKREAAQIFLGEVIRTIDGPLAPFEDAESLRQLVERDQKHRELFRVLLSVRDAAAAILDHTSLSDICQVASSVLATNEPVPRRSGPSRQRRPLASPGPIGATVPRIASFEGSVSNK
jgi:Rrf2 family protein